MKLLTTDTEMSLPSPLGEKVFIHQLQVNINMLYCLVTRSQKSKLCRKRRMYFYGGMTILAQLMLERSV